MKLNAFNKVQSIFSKNDAKFRARFLIGAIQAQKSVTR